MTADIVLERALELWDIPMDVGISLLNISENETFLLSNGDGFKSVLRVHRAGYHDARAIGSELSWMRAISEAGDIIVPDYILGRNGEAIQYMGRYCVMFEFLCGHEPRADDNLIVMFERLGEITARLHLHSALWQRPDNFHRHRWDIESVFGDSPTWGRWEDAPGLDGEMTKTLGRLEICLRARLGRFGMSPLRFGLIHADMRLANLLLDEDNIYVIDFDDCGFSWFLYDFAAAVSFIEDSPKIPSLKASWVKGYRKFRSLSVAEEHELDSFILLRRMLLLAWIGSHNETDLARSQESHFAPVSALLAERYLSDYG